MPSGLLPTQIQNNTIATLNGLNKRKVVQTQKFQAYSLYSNLWMGDNPLSAVRDGKKNTIRVRARPQAGFRSSGLYAVEPAARDDTLVEIACDWYKWSQNSLVFDVDDHIFNRGESEIVNWIEQEYNGADENTANELEERSLHAPPTSTSVGEMNGLFYWLAPVPTGTTDPIGGFNGITTYFRTSGSTTTIGGQDRNNALNYNLRNWCASNDGTFGSATRELVARAITDCRFMSIPGNGEFKASANRTATFMLMLNSNHFHEYEGDVNKGPDDKNGDLRRFNTNLKFRGIPITQAFVLDQSDVAVTGQNPGNNILGVNTAALYAFKEPGTWNKDMEPLTNYDAPTVFRVHRRGWGNIWCPDARGGGFRIAPGGSW